MSARSAISVRMYHVGFGDCFLLSFPGKRGRRHLVLVDCGVHTAGVDTPMDRVTSALIGEIKRNGGRLELVVATHRHRDHVSGFESAAWRDVEVGEVWLPWTEDPEDGEAQAVTSLHERLAIALERRALALTGPTGTAVAQLAGNSRPNAAAMAMLVEGFKGDARRRFLPSADEPASRLQEVPVLKVEGVPGLRAHVLGPSRDPAVIRDLRPPKGESYLRGAELEANNELRPFARRLALSASAYHAAWERKRYGAGSPPRLSESDIAEIRRAGSGREFALAAGLEAAVNGTSLVLMFQMGAAFLLFPGDAQWGTWHRMLTSPKIAALLKRTTFLKVGHHGSHNATPVEFVEAILPLHTTAMLSTRHMKMWPRIPRRALLAALEGRSTTLVRSDRTVRLPRQGRRTALWTEIQVPT